MNMNVSFKIEKGSDDTLYFADDRLSGFYYGDTARTRKQARKDLNEQVDDALTTAQNNNKAYMVACGDGTIILVRYSHQSWGYTFFGPNRKNQGSGGCVTGDSYDETVIAARKHAKDCFGGIAWEGGNFSVD